jgi:hypothetical protein
LLAAGLHSPAFCCGGWLARPSGHHGHWGPALEHWLLTRILGQAREEKCEQGSFSCRPGSLFLWLSPLYRRLCPRHQKPSQSTLPAQILTIVKREEEMWPPNYIAIARATVSRDLVLLCRHGDVDCSFANCVGRTGPPEKPTIWRLFSLVFGDDGGGAGRNDPNASFVNDQPGFYPRSSRLSDFTKGGSIRKLHCSLMWRSPTQVVMGCGTRHLRNSVKPSKLQSPAGS